MKLDKLCGYEHFCFDTKRSSPRFIDGVDLLGPGYSGRVSRKTADESQRHITLKVEFKDGGSKEVDVAMTEAQENNITGVKIIGNKPAR